MKAARAETWSDPAVKCRACGEGPVEITDQRTPHGLERSVKCWGCGQEKTYRRDRREVPNA